MYKSGRRPWKSGRWLFEDEESGIITYSDKVVRDYKGLYVRRQYVDHEHPQDFIKALPDPTPLPYSHPFPRPGHICNITPVFVGNTSVTAKNYGAADHLFRANGIGSMSIGCSFIIYPEST